MERETGLEPATSSLGSWHSEPPTCASGIVEPDTTCVGSYHYEIHIRTSTVRLSPATRAKDVRCIYRPAARYSVEYRVQEGSRSDSRPLVSCRGVCARGLDA